MGMFDYITCKMPLLEGQDEEFQTKDVENSLARLEITKDGFLVRNNQIWNEEEAVDEPDPKGAKYILDWFSGRIGFYGGKNLEFHYWVVVHSGKVVEGPKVFGNSIHLDEEKDHAINNETLYVEQSK